MHISLKNSTAVLLLIIGFSAFRVRAEMLPQYSSINPHSLCRSNIELCRANLKITTAESAADFEAYLSRGTEAVEKVIIVIHGTDRNANEYLNDFISNIKEESLLSNAVVIAPHFLQVNDSYNTKQLRWEPGWEHSWKYGNAAAAPIEISSFEIIDQLVKEIDQNLKPKKIIIMGHSAGGQFVQRYAHGSVVAKIINSVLLFVPSNPSSYLYTRAVRLINNKWDIPQECSDYNKYIYGLSERNVYLLRMDDLELEKNYLQNNVTYLMGNEDVLSEDLDSSCEANLQGENRIMRARTYFKFLNNFFPGHHHQFRSVSGVGHDHVRMFSSKEFLAIFN